MSAFNATTVGSQMGYYLLQINNSESGSYEAVPIHLLNEGLGNKHESYFEPVVQGKHFENEQHCIKPSELHDVNTTESQNTSNIDHNQYHTTNNIIDSNLHQLSNVSNIGVTSEAPILKSEIVINVPLTNIPTTQDDTKNQYMFHTIHIPDKKVPPRAVAVLPTILQIRQGQVSPRRTLPANICFGPVEGIVNKVCNADAMELAAKAATSNTPIFFKGRDDTFVLHIDVSDQDKSSWISLLPLGDQLTANVWLYENNGELYGVTTNEVACRVPLVLGYSRSYTEIHCLPQGQPILDLYEALPTSSKVQQTNNLTLLQNHLDIYEKDEQPLPRGYYRCNLCSRTFSRLFTLKRHRLGYCTKNDEKPNNSNIESPDKSDAPVTPMDDTRVPSDDSLQNFTGLDFSTNLFDTDRISNLDISGSSRSETDFNPYSICFKEELYLDNPDKCSVDGEKETTSTTTNKKATKKDEKVLVECHRCNQTIAKGKKRAHLRDCPARKFTCECGLVFIKKESLAIHVHTVHKPQVNEQPQNETESKLEETNETSYKCDDCNFIFKRRGMLSNHLWRVHGVAARMPVVRRVRHYPCAVCPKLYNARAKRDHHQARHHPGVCAQLAPAPIEGSRRLRSAAACAACPRQYATRAKLLQHVRAAHPHLAPPKNKGKSNSEAEATKR